MPARPRRDAESFTTPITPPASGISSTRSLRSAPSPSGDPVEVLCRWLVDAKLLVVGSRGLGGFNELVLGSVGTKSAHHSRCPVVVVPGHRSGSMSSQ